MAGARFIWVSIFVIGYRAELQGAAYVLLAVSLVAAAWEAGAIALAALRNAEQPHAGGRIGRSAGHTGRTYRETAQLTQAGPFRI